MFILKEHQIQCFLIGEMEEKTKIFLKLLKLPNVKFVNYDMPYLEKLPKSLRLIEIIFKRQPTIFDNI